MLEKLPSLSIEYEWGSANAVLKHVLTISRYADLHKCTDKVCIEEERFRVVDQASSVESLKPDTRWCCNKSTLAITTSGETSGRSPRRRTLGVEDGDATKLRNHGKLRGQ